MSGKNNFLSIAKDLEKAEENKGYLILMNQGDGVIGLFCLKKSNDV